jgi:hypothetical protein
MRLLWTLEQPLIESLLAKIEVETMLGLEYSNTGAILPADVQRRVEGALDEISLSAPSSPRRIPN